MGYRGIQLSSDGTSALEIPLVSSSIDERCRAIASRILAAIVLPLALSACGGSGGDHAAVSRRAEWIYESMMSPYCPELTLAACPSEEATVLRAEIRRELAAGWTESQVREALHARFGALLDGTPPARGLGVLALVLPGMLIVLGTLALGAWIRRSAGTSTQPDKAYSVVSPRNDARADDDNTLRERLDTLLREDR